MLQAAVRVPDHGALAPWRILAIEGDARLRLGVFLAQRTLELEPAAPTAVLDKDRLRFARAPLVLVVIATPAQGSKIPEIEQVLSAGAVCFALLQAAQALGFGAQWLTGWLARDRIVQQHLGLRGNECIVGFVHIGTPTGPVAERKRPEWTEHYSVWPG